MLMRRVVTAHGSHHVRVNTIHRNKQNNAQKWVFDEVTKTIKNKQWPNKSLSMRGNNVVVENTNSRWFQLWEYKDGFLVNTHGKVLDVSGNGADRENQNIIAHPKHGRINQQFDLIYADAWPADPAPGEVHPRFGFRVQRPFFLLTALPSGRYMDYIDAAGSDVMIKQRSGGSHQQWIFDVKT
jgi:hypothetical protein